MVGISLIGLVPVLSGAVPRLRPPGALLEQKFLASCIKCGQCVQVCPVNAIELADLDEGFGIGTPFIDARAQACDFSCDGLQCVLACPTGSLTHEINYSHETRMGFARLDKPKLCLAMQGKGFSGVARGPDFPGKLRFDEIDRWNPLNINEQPFDVEICDLCVRTCPIEIRIAQCEAGKPPSGDTNQCPPLRAIRLEEVTHADGSKGMRPTVLDGCVGCGVCEMICPTEEASIVIDIRKTAEDV
ncbi:4Fe-4S binding protein [Candidatus Reidiella endopervernicosa]|nr:4Fe-4S binding protein [Candidatus Reidiella endopervernicosa]